MISSDYINFTRDNTNYGYVVCIISDFTVYGIHAVTHCIGIRRSLNIDNGISSIYSIINITG